MTEWLTSGRRPLLIGLGMLAFVTTIYPLIARTAEQPLSIFALPPLVTAVLAGWRPTLMVGLASLAVAVVVGLFAPLTMGAIALRWIIIATAVVVAAGGGAIREAQANELGELNELMSLRAAFERALAPAPVPPPGFVAVARYSAAGAGMHIGGDFLEAIAVGDGRLAVLMGDVCGHGPREAAFGAALRAGWKSIALGGGTWDPAEWVAALNHAFFLDGRIDVYATLCTGFLDRSTCTARLVNVAHPPPIVLQSPVHTVDLPVAPPLGLGLGDSWTSQEIEWKGEPMLLYTDGLIENPARTGPPRRWGVDGLVAWLDTHPSGDLRGVVRELIEDATADR
ncbi:MAG TPA: PP2C family protein-serine/threonine phosphatase, partial [Ilumatobacteraceae bacterium]